MKLAIVQMDIVFGDTEKNYKAVEKYIEEAVKTDVDVIVFPEMWNTGYALNRLSELADDNGLKTKGILSGLAKKHNVNIVGGSVATKRENRFYNTMYVANRSGNIIAEYDKAHLFKLMDEHLYMEQGQKDNVFEMDGTVCGGVICYDLRFPEWIRVHTLAGAKVIFVPAEWPKKRIDHWQVLLQARAIENQCFVVAVNRVGTDPNNVFNGQSMVIAPWGEVMLSKQTGEGIYYIDLNLQEVEDVRKRIPIYEDRRTDLYNTK
jgi:omega-amidase